MAKRVHNNLVAAVGSVCLTVVRSTVRIKLYDNPVRMCIQDDGGS